MNTCIVMRMAAVSNCLQRSTVSRRNRWGNTQGSRPGWLSGWASFSSSVYEGEMSRGMMFECMYPRVEVLDRAAFRGRVVLIVNSASKCTHATQLHGLQKLFDTYHSRGLDVIAVPSNDFDRKEPGGDEEIKMIYTNADTYQVQFPITKKTRVIDEDAHAFFALVAERYGRSVAPTWNFDKFLVDAYGDLTAVFPHDTDPLEPEVIEAIEDALADIPAPTNEEEDE